jgi:hypothetical protein
LPSEISNLQADVKPDPELGELLDAAAPIALPRYSKKAPVKLHCRI